MKKPTRKILFNIASTLFIISLMGPAHAEIINHPCVDENNNHYMVEIEDSVPEDERDKYCIKDDGAAGAGLQSQGKEVSDNVDNKPPAPVNKKAVQEVGVWEKCSGESEGADALKDKIKSCYSATDLNFSEVATNNIMEGTAAAQNCQRLLTKAVDNMTWKQITMETYDRKIPTSLNNPKAFAKLVAIYLNNLSGISSGEEPSDSNIKDATKMSISCLQLAAAVGQNMKEGRETEDAYSETEKLTSLDGKITCKVSGLETLDYDECSNLVLAHNAAQLGKTATATYQTISAQEFRSDQQNDLLNMDGTENVTTVALKAQKDGLNKQQEMAEQRRALELARLATIGEMSRQIPTSEDYFDNRKLCADPIDQAKDIASQMGVDLTSATTAALCSENFLNGGFAFLRNGAAKRVGFRIMAEAGIDAAAETMSIEQLGKQKSMINNAIGKIEGMDTIKLPEGFFDNEEVYAQFCSVNPTHAQCQSGYGAATNVPSFGDYNMGGFGTNQAYQQNEDEAVVTATAASSSDPTSAGVETGTAVDKKTVASGLNGNYGSAASVSEGGQLAQGSGGGGSSPGGGGGGGGSSAGGDGQGQPQGTGSVNGTKGLSYVGGGGPSFVGGRGTSRSRKPSSANPFKNMFNKTKDRNLSSLNYKGKTAIGSKTGNLFDRISSAYDKANNSGNLLKYETKTLE